MRSDPMSTMTIHGLDKETERRVRAESKRTGLSLNRTLKRLLGEAAGKKPAPLRAGKNDFADMLGLWSKKDLAEFEKATAKFRVVHREDWR
jgi:hypothetical protein